MLGPVTPVEQDPLCPVHFWVFRSGHIAEDAEIRPITDLVLGGSRKSIIKGLRNPLTILSVLPWMIPFAVPAGTALHIRAYGWTVRST